MDGADVQAILTLQGASDVAGDLHEYEISMMPHNRNAFNMFVL